MKRCTKCDIEKSEDAFEMQPSRGRLRSECRECRRIADREWRTKRKLNPPKLKSETKRCKRCQEVKSISEFSPGNPGYFHPQCKACERTAKQEKRREKYQSDPAGRFYWPFVNEDGITVKRCTYCHAEKPLSEFYTNGAQGRHGKCKVCDKATNKAIYDTHPEKYREAVRKSMRKHPDRHHARHSRWSAVNQMHLTRYRSERRVIHHERLLAYDRMRHIRNAEQEQLYRITHRYEASERASRRRAREQNAPRIEKINRKALIERDQWTCYLCGCICTPKNVTLDHVIPLIHGGSHTTDNLRVACLSCNCSKGTRHLRDFLA